MLWAGMAFQVVCRKGLLMRNRVSREKKEERRKTRKEEEEEDKENRAEKRTEGTKKREGRDGTSLEGPAGKFVSVPRTGSGGNNGLGRFDGKCRPGRTAGSTGGHFSTRRDQLVSEASAGRRSRPKTGARCKASASHGQGAASGLTQSSMTILSPEHREGRVHGWPLARAREKRKKTSARWFGPMRHGSRGTPKGSSRLIAEVSETGI